MEIEKIRDEAKKRLANFVNIIGFDGDFYASNLNCPIMWAKTVIDAPGQFLGPGSEKLETMLQDSKYDEEKKIIEHRGLILIREDYKQKEPDSELLVSIMHEMIHSDRNLEIFDVIRDGENEKAYSFNNNKFEQNSSEYGYSNVDASQNILKGSIDTSKKIVDNYKDATSKEIEDIGWEEGKMDEQLEKQIIVDETLVELMSILAYRLYKDKEKGKTGDIWQEIEQAKEGFEGEDIGAMCKIILRHHDLELFKWMILPIYYSQGDIHYDFFGEYSKNDSDLVQELYANSTLYMEDLNLPLPNNKKSKSKEGDLLQNIYSSIGIDINDVLRSLGSYEITKQE